MQVMEKIRKGQVAKILVVFLLLLMIPFVSASMRTSFLYLLLNFLIVVLAIDSGVVGAFPDGDQKIKPTAISPPPPASTPTAPPPSSEPKATHVEAVAGKAPTAGRVSVLAGKAPTAGRASVAPKPKQRPSVPSLFFIGDGGEDGDFVNKGDSETEDDEPAGDATDVGAQELFLKAEAFIGNFYRQLKIQREDSWRRLHHLHAHISSLHAMRE